MPLPKQIKATKTMVYDVDVALSMATEQNIDTTNWTTQDVINFLDFDISEDFGSDNPTFEEIY